MGSQSCLTPSPEKKSMIRLTWTEMNSDDCLVCMHVGWYLRINVCVGQSKISQLLNGISCSGCTHDFG